MQEETQEYLEIKEYLLGTVTPEEARERVEERLMLDEEYYEDMLAVEEELIQNYADGKLSPAEKQAFELNFPISGERSGKVKFARTFRTYLDAHEAAERPHIAVKERFSFARLFSYSPAFRTAGAFASVAALLFASFLAWNWYSNYSAGNEAWVSFNKAYKNERPFQSRIAQMDYAPLPRLRGNAEKPVDKLELSRAERQIQENAAKNRTAANLHALGSLYLANSKFDEAIAAFVEAQGLDVNNAEILSDLGVARLEKGLSEEDPGKRTRLVYQALDDFENALKKDPNLLAALFNRARCLGAMHMKDQEREAWQNYLNHDSTSRWADEARNHLQDLTPQISKDISPEDLQQAFLADAQNQKDDEAIGLISRNRELIKKKYLPQTLAMSLVEAQGERKTELLGGLKYLGKLEKERYNDLFASDLTEFYSNLTPQKTALIKAAQKAVQEGYTLCLDFDDFYQSLGKFIEARKLFLQAGDDIEANTVAQHFIAYCLYNTRGRKEAYELLRQVDDYSQQKNYKWFSLMNLYWFISSKDYLGYITMAETIDSHEKALKQAKEIGDSYMTQKFLQALVSKNCSLKEHEKAFSYLSEQAELSSLPDLSPRQTFRSLNSVVSYLAHNQYTGASKAVARETLKFAEALKDPLFTIGYEKNSGMIYTETGDYPEAEKWLTDAKQKIETLKDENRREYELASIFSLLGSLESRKGNFYQSAKYFDQSIAPLEKAVDTSLGDARILLYDAKKSRLAAYQAYGDDDTVGRDLPSTLEMAEEYRNNAKTEKEKESFFSNQQEIYDIGMEHEFRENNAEQAFYYAESSNYRSLLDLLQKEAKTSFGKGVTEGAVTEPSRPLRLDEIQKRMPANVQILQYAVLKDRVLIWVISKDAATLVSSEISAGDLNGKIKNYLSVIRSTGSEQQELANKMSRELYDLLVAKAVPYLKAELEICIVPNKKLSYLPFSSLISADGKYLLEKFGLFFSPSANVFIISTEEAGKRNVGENEHLLSVGNPTFDRKKLPGLADLPESANEASDIAENYSRPTILVENRATKSAFQHALKDADVIHFAGHYIAHPDAPLLSELVMAKSSNQNEDNFFTNAELKNEKLPRTKLVILSACQTGIEGDYNGKEVSGLSHTFLSLGVPLVIASQWPVESLATAQLMKKFHSYRKHGNLSANHALRKAQLEMISNPGSQYRAAYYWASFAAFGGYTDF